MMYSLGTGLIRTLKSALIANFARTNYTKGIDFLLKMALLAIELTFSEVRHRRYRLPAEVTPHALSTDHLCMFGLGFGYRVII